MLFSASSPIRRSAAIRPRHVGKHPHPCNSCICSNGPGRRQRRGPKPPTWQDHHPAIGPPPPPLPSRISSGGPSRVVLLARPAVHGTVFLLSITFFDLHPPHAPMPLRLSRVCWLLSGAVCSPLPRSACYGGASLPCVLLLLRGAVPSPTSFLHCQGAPPLPNLHLFRPRLL
jgi:hypothetical protein